MSPKPHGFSRVERLRRKRDFDAVFQDGSRFCGRMLIVRARPNDLPHARLGMMIAKQFGNAVRRNRIRRLIREAFRLNKPPASVGLDLVVTLTRGWKDASFDEVQTDWCRLVERIRERLPNEMAVDRSD